jgi:hypothetical protein
MELDFGARAPASWRRSHGGLESTMSVSGGGEQERSGTEKVGFSSARVQRYSANTPR